MREFRIRVNGKEYEVQVEELKNRTLEASPASQSIAKEPMQSKPVQSKPAPAPSKKVPETSSASSDKVAAPMPGNIISVGIKQGDSVKQGDLLFVLEAMKMENEIFAQKTGKVVEVNVSAGVAVNAGDVLAVIQ